MTSGQDAGALAAPVPAAGDDAPAAGESAPAAGDDAHAAGDDAPAAGDDAPAAGDDGHPVRSGESREPGRSAGAPAWAAAMAVLLALLIAGIVVAAVSGARARGYDAAGSRRQAAVAAARQAVADLTTADYQHPQEYVDRLRGEATGKFLRLFTNSAAGFKNVLIRGKVQTAGRVADVGVRRAGQDTAQLSVLAYVTVKNSQSPKGERRAYRLSVSLISAGPHWLVSDVEFVK